MNEVSVGVSPQSVTVVHGHTQNFNGIVLGTVIDGSVTWTVEEGASGGSITADGLYTAPETPGTYHVAAVSVTDPSKSASATVTVGLEMYGTCSSGGASAVSDLGGIPIDYRNQDFVKEIHRFTGEGVDVVFDPIGGTHLWQSRKALRPGGSVVGYGLRSSLRGEGLASGTPGRRQRFRGTAIFGLYIAGGWLLPGRKRVVPYSIQTLKRVKSEFFQQDLIALLDLLQQKKIKPLIAQRLPLAKARQAQESLGKGGVIVKIVLVPNAPSVESGSV